MNTELPPQSPEPPQPVLGYARVLPTAPETAGRSMSRALAFWGGTAVGTFALLGCLILYNYRSDVDEMTGNEFWSMVGASAALGVILGGVGGIFVQSRLNRYSFSAERSVRRGTLRWAFVAGAGYFTIPTLTIMAAVMTVHVHPLLVLVISLVWLVGYPEGVAFLLGWHSR